MAHRYLFGPIAPQEAISDRIAALRAAGECVSFGPSRGADLTVGPDDDWAAVASRFPPGWRPDFVALYLPYTTVPEWLLDAPIPVIGVAAEARLLWHYYRHRLPSCDAFFADPATIARAERENLGLGIPANLSGFAAARLSDPVEHDGRGIDLLFVANCNPAVQPERGAWLRRLARFGEDHTVVVRTGVFGPAYFDLLRRAKLVFSHTRPGGGYRRVFEAAAAGALVLQETGDHGLTDYLPNGHGCVYFSGDEFESVAERLLTAEAERRRLVEAGRSAVRACSFDALWRGALDRLALVWDEVAARARRRTRDPARRLTARVWQAACSPSAPDGALLDDLESAARTDDRTDGGALAHAGVVRSTPHFQGGDRLQTALDAAENFRRASAAVPTDPVFATNRAVALALAGQREAALDQARATLARLQVAEPAPGPWTEQVPYPPAFDWVRGEWDRVAFAGAGDPVTEAAAKVVILRWRLQTLMFELTGNPVHAYEAFHARPDLPVACAALGRALAQTGHPWEALGYLQQAVHENPCDRTSARVLYHVLGETVGGASRFPFAHEQNLLAAVAPQLAPPEEWFREGPAELPAEPILVSATFPRDGAPPARAALAEPIAAGPVKPIRLSLSMIVKNEEANLPHCLGSVADLVDEIVIADTGSTDRTREIAARFGARVVDFPWRDDFGAARNASLERTTGKWVLWLDGDDRIDEPNRAKLRALVAKLGDETDAYAMKVRSVLDPVRNETKLLDQVRLFRNHPQVRWQYRIHEQILPAVNRLGGDVRWTDVIIDHVGYADQDVRRRKLLRNLRLLELEEAERPDDAFNLFNLGWTTLDLGRPIDALPYLKRSLERAEPGASIVRKLHVLLTQTYQRLGRPDEALAACQSGRERLPEDVELLFEEALLLRHKKDFAAVEDRLLRLMTLQTRPYFASLDAGLRTFRARHLLGVVYAEQEKWIEAEAQLRAAATDKPDFAPAWLSLGELYLAQQRWPALERTALELERANDPLGAVVLRARGRLARNDHDGARAELERALEHAPTAVGAWALLSHVLLQQGTDWDAAERALLRIIALDPTNAEARHNLDVLRRQHPRT